MHYRVFLWSPLQQATTQELHSMPPLNGGSPIHYRVFLWPILQETTTEELHGMPPLKEAVPCITVIFDSLAYKRQQQRKYIECLL